MWDMQYQTFLQYVRTYFPQYVHLLPQSPNQAQQPGSAAGQEQGVQGSEIRFVTKQQAESYIPKSQTPVALWDQDTNTIYLIRQDEVGRTIRETLTWEKCASQETPPATGSSGTQYATAADVADLRSQIAALTEALHAALPARQEASA